MPRKGEIRLSTNLKHIREVLDWFNIQIRTPLIPLPTELGSEVDESEHNRTLIAFKKRLHKALHRKRPSGKNGVTLNAPGEEIAAFARSQDSHFFRAGLTNLRFRRLALIDDIVRSTRPRGRPKLTSAQRSKRLSKNYHIGDRQKPRIRKANKIAKRDAEWSRSLLLRDETILTDTVGRPKI